MHQSGGGATMLLSSLLPPLPKPAVAAEELKPASGLLELSSWCCWPPPLSLSAPMHKLRGRDEEEGSTKPQTQARERIRLWEGGMREREARETIRHSGRGGGGPHDLAFSQLPHSIAKHTDRHHLTLIAYIFRAYIFRPVSTRVS